MAYYRIQSQPLQIYIKCVPTLFKGSNGMRCEWLGESKHVIHNQNNHKLEVWEALTMATQVVCDNVVYCCILCFLFMYPLYCFVLQE